MNKIEQRIKDLEKGTIFDNARLDGFKEALRLKDEEIKEKIGKLKEETKYLNESQRVIVWEIIDKIFSEETHSPQPDVKVIAHHNGEGETSSRVNRAGEGELAQNPSDPSADNYNPQTLSGGNGRVSPENNPVVSQDSPADSIGNVDITDIMFNKQ
jgi:hypothetical protein